MNITFYNNESENNVFNKRLTTITSLTGNLKSDTSIVDPIITIQGSLTTFITSNYLRINEFNRYYFITDMISKGNNLVEVHCHCDVLYSFKDSILANTALISRQENLESKYIGDSVQPMNNNNIIDLYNADGDTFTTNHGCIGLLVSCNTHIEGGWSHSSSSHSSS